MRGDHHRLQTVKPSITVVRTITMMPARQRDGDVMLEFKRLSDFLTLVELARGFSPHLIK